MKDEWWIVVDKNGCPCKAGKSAEDAAEMSALCDLDWPDDAPHRAVCVVPAEEVEALRAENARLRTWHGDDVVLCIDGEPACNDCLCAGTCLNVRPEPA